MAGFHFDNLANNLPDCYKKGESSNNYKILETEREANAISRASLAQIAGILNIDNATGYTLDMYGKRFGQARGKATDEQYRLMIKSKVVRSLSSGSYKDIVDALCYTFSCTKDDVLLTETENAASVVLEKLSLGSIIAAGFSTKQAEKIIKKLLPIGVTLESVMFEGTFEFSALEADYDEEKGFSESEDGSIGGYLGWTGSQESIDELPI